MFSRCFLMLHQHHINIQFVNMDTKRVQINLSLSMVFVFCIQRHCATSDSHDIFEVIITWVRLLISNFVEHHVDFEIILLKPKFSARQTGPVIRDILTTCSYKTFSGPKT